MSKTILVTGATDGIGLETAHALAAEGHTLLLHGRSPQKLDQVVTRIPGTAKGYIADLAHLDQVARMADEVSNENDRIDVLINNAGVFKTPSPITAEGLDVRIAVNTIAPYLLTRRLIPLLGPSGRIVNLSSAAQAPLDLALLRGEQRASDMEAYAQSKLALTVWTALVAQELPNGPAIYAVNPGSLLASKMVKEGFGVAGNDLSIGVDILKRAALSEEFEGRSGDYFDNDAGRFAEPHAGARDAQVLERIIPEMDKILSNMCV